MLIGLVGKPSSGKSTFFKSASLADVLIANYPFATIKPNRGIGYVKIDCIDKEFKTKCNPSHGYCVDGKRFVPVELLDVAGLVEGASEGKGLGNQFLDNLTGADALIHIVDASGETTSDGKEGKGNPIDDIRMLENELDLWYLGILKKAWRNLTKTIQVQKQDFSKAVAKQFSGLKVEEGDVKTALLRLDLDAEKCASWNDEELRSFANTLRHISKPMIIAANKCDKPSAEGYIVELKKEYPHIIIIPCSADSELALREANNHNLIEYIPGDSDFKIKGELNEKQKQALIRIKENVLDMYGSTGIQDVLNYVVFDLLKYIAVFPASANKLGDSKGNILPDCFLISNGSTALDFAFKVHEDLGKNFIRAVNARTKQTVGKDYKVKHRDGLEIIT